LPVQAPEGHTWSWILCAAIVILFFRRPTRSEDGSEHKEFMHGESAATLVFFLFPAARSMKWDLFLYFSK
jgi:hypothetical protein